MKVVILGLMLGGLAQSPSVGVEPFGVTYAGEPAVLVSLAIEPSSDLMRHATVVHRLRFDGIGYESHLGLPLIETAIIRRGCSDLRWKHPAGSHVDLSSGRTVPLFGVEWESDVRGDTVTISATSGLETYVYESGRLEAALVRGVWYTWAYKGGRKLDIHRIGRSGRSSILFTMRDGGGNTIYLSIDNRAVSLTYDQEKRLILVSDSVRGVTSFEYKNGLLVKVHDKRGTRIFEWGAPRQRVYVRPPVPAPPIVSFDGIYRYEAVLKRRHIAISYRDVTRGHSGGWRYQGDR